MSQGRTPDTGSLLNASREYCDSLLPDVSIFRLLYRHCHELFPDAMFGDLYSGLGRSSVPPRIVAVVMILQRLEGLSDREAVERFAFDARWKYAAGGLDPDYPSFVHTVLVDMRARLRRSESPDRIFDAVVGVAKEAGLIGRRRVLDSTALYDAVATQDTVTMIRSAIRGLLKACTAELASQLRSVLKRDDTYETPGKPVCDWDDAEARTLLIDELARDGYAVLAELDGMTLEGKLQDAATLLATVLGQDLEETDDGTFRIARRVAKDRVISTVDPEARHGHKTSSRSFDGYKAHVAIDPDTELVTATVVTAGNVADGDKEVVENLLSDLLPAESAETSERHENSGQETDPNDRSQGTHEMSATTGADDDDALSPSVNDESDAVQTQQQMPPQGILLRIASFVVMMVRALVEPTEALVAGASVDDPQTPERCRPEAYGDASYGTATVLEMLEGAGIDVHTKVQQPASVRGMFAQSEFQIDLDNQQVTCPGSVTVPLRASGDGSATAHFGSNCENCPLREQCTQAQAGRTVNVHAKHEILHRHRQEQKVPEWRSNYRAIRPKVERKIAHLMRRRHGGRRARVRGATRIGHDFALLAAAVNLNRLSQLGLERQNGVWLVAQA